MAKKEKKPKTPTQVWKLYEVKGDSVERKNTTCPKCGDGYFMAKHGNRLTCGKCYYTEFIGEEKKQTPKSPKKGQQPSKEPKKEEPKPEYKPAEKPVEAKEEEAPDKESEKKTKPKEETKE